jgi:hypothetical protein
MLASTSVGSTSAQSSPSLPLTVSMPVLPLAKNRSLAPPPIRLFVPAPP